MKLQYKRKIKRNVQLLQNKEKSEKLQGSLKNYGYSTDRISIAISKDKFLNSIIDLCTINFCPFSIVEYSGKKDR